MGMNEIAQESTKSKQDRVETCRTHIPTGPEEAGIEIAVGFKGEKKMSCAFTRLTFQSRCSDGQLTQKHRRARGNKSAQTEVQLTLEQWRTTCMQVFSNTYNQPFQTVGSASAD